MKTLLLFAAFLAAGQGHADELSKLSQSDEMIGCGCYGFRADSSGRPHDLVFAWPDLYPAAVNLAGKRRAIPVMERSMSNKYDRIGDEFALHGEGEDIGFEFNGRVKENCEGRAADICENIRYDGALAVTTPFGKWRSKIQLYCGC